MPILGRVINLLLSFLPEFMAMGSTTFYLSSTISLSKQHHSSSLASSRPKTSPLPPSQLLRTESIILMSLALILSIVVKFICSALGKGSAIRIYNDLCKYQIYTCGISLTLAFKNGAICSFLLCGVHSRLRDCLSGFVGTWQCIDRRRNAQKVAVDALIVGQYNVAAVDAPRKYDAGGPPPQLRYPDLGAVGPNSRIDAPFEFEGAFAVQLPFLEMALVLVVFIPLEAAHPRLFALFELAHVHRAVVFLQGDLDVTLACDFGLGDDLPAGSIKVPVPPGSLPEVILAVVSAFALNHVVHKVTLVSAAVDVVQCSLTVLLPKAELAFVAVGPYGLNPGAVGQAFLPAANIRVGTVKVCDFALTFRLGVVNLPLVE